EGNVGDRTIYVKLTPHKYKLSFDKNTDSIKDFKGEKLKSSGNMKKQTVTFGKNTAITKNGYKVTGYTFTGWNTKPDGSGKSYSDKEEVLNLTSESGEIIQLYAVWKKAEYTISYIGLDEEEVEKFALPTNYRIDDETITFEPYKAAIERTGYTFKNFYSDKKYKNVLKSIKSGSTGNKSVYVKMVANKYKLLFKRNEESLEGKPKCSGKMSAQTVTYDKKTKISANAFKINGYTFTGWNTEADGTGKSYENKEEILNLTSGNGETITLYAQWQKK
ncbi:MAG: InlB B-repeat-containing protein, partial [Lachnospiraceae bacterium]|nr:InlB B-repeat-containing protein [Lachnospiraceae bacterium]